MSLAAWYNQQFAQNSPWSRTRRLQSAPYLARTDTSTARAATAMANTRLANANDIALADVPALGFADPAASAGAAPAGKNKSDTLFGPNIGIVGSGPAWTEALAKKQTAEELTVDIVKGWIAKSKQSSQPTTTLQALVNLKRPTLRLSPLKPASEEDLAAADHHHHALEFEYDCDAPRCGIYVHAVVSPDHPAATGIAPASTGTGSANDADAAAVVPIPVFDTITDGGFGNKLKLEDGAMLELGMYEHIADPGPAPVAAPISDEPRPSTAVTSLSAESPTATSPSTAAERRSRRFSSFHFRKRHSGAPADRSVAGPALAVVDAEAGAGASADTEAAAGAGANKDGGAKDADEGVRVMIRLVALDEQGRELASANEQVTYLHVVRFGARPAPVEGEAEAEDTRPWVVKVVKREAVIGPHVFHLHEIYGLSSHSSAPAHPVAPAAPIPTGDAHAYPPTSPTAAAAPSDDEPSSECLLCLSSPREVVLLPCRHLVACKECALNMIEFGAGGNIVHAEPEAEAGATVEAGAAAGAEGAAAATGAEGAAATSAAEATAAAAAAPTPIVQPRRKRKAKGWFCPVCRQPYTSLLRITTAPPADVGKGEHAHDGSSSIGKDVDGDESAEEDTEGGAPPAPGANAAAPSSPRPGFLRGLSLGSRSAAALSSPADVERGA